MTDSKFRYQIIIFPEQQVPFEVEAASTIEACLEIQKKLTIDSNGSFLDFGLLEIGPMTDMWLVMRTSPYEYCNFLHIEEWDGKMFHSFAKTSIGNGIIEAVRSKGMALEQRADNDNYACVPVVNNR